MDAVTRTFNYTNEDRPIDRSIDRQDERDRRIGIWTMTVSEAIVDVHNEQLRPGCKYHLNNDGETFFVDVFYSEDGELVCQHVESRKIMSVLCFAEASWRRA